jgi:putative transposase
MREIKKSSSAWMHDVMKRDTFAWQEGYAAFTVIPTARESVDNYIENQEEHHRKKTFREELIDFLIRAEIKFDERYLD